MNKDFDSWHKLKSKIQANKSLPSFEEREVWWCSIGANVGVEEDGKNEMFSRPVLIIRKFNHTMFWGVPLTTAKKEDLSAQERQYYYKIKLQGKDGFAMLSQLKTFDSKRLTKIMGKMPTQQIVEIKNALTLLLYRY
jgi:mRNA-degrading endonuclease toxin of MazEF toxin-antitoxin module